MEEITLQRIYLVLRSDENWDGQEPFVLENHDYNFCAYEYIANNDTIARTIGMGNVFREDWIKDGSKWRMFRKSNGWPTTWVQVD